MIEVKNTSEFKIKVIAKTKGEFTRTAENGSKDDFFQLKLTMKHLRLGAQRKPYYKNVWQNTDELIFDYISDYIMDIEDDERKGLKEIEIDGEALHGAFYRMAVPSQYEGYHFEDSNGKDQLASTISFFIFEEDNADPMAQFKRECNRITRAGKWKMASAKPLTFEDNDDDAENDTADKNKSGRRKP